MHPYDIYYDFHGKYEKIIYSLQGFRTANYDTQKIIFSVPVA